MEWLRPVAVDVAQAMHRGCILQISDLVQIGAVAAVEAVETFQPDRGATLKSWQWKRARWAMQDAIMRSARHYRLVPPCTVYWQMDRPTPDRSAENLAMARIRAAVAGLPPRDRQLLTMIYWHDATMIAAGRTIGVSHTAAAKYHRRALDALRTTLQETAP